MRSKWYVWILCSLCFIAFVSPAATSNKNEPPQWVHKCFGILLRTLKVISFLGDESDAIQEGTNGIASPLVGSAKDEQWFERNPELRTLLIKARPQFLNDRKQEMLREQSAGRVKLVPQFPFLGDVLYPTQCLGFGYGGEGVVYVANAGKEERIFKIFHNQIKYDNHKIRMAELNRIGVPIVRNPREDPENLTMELEPTRRGIPLNVIQESGRKYGFMQEQVDFILAAYEAHYKKKYLDPRVEKSLQNVLIDMYSGKFYLFDPH